MNTGPVQTREKTILTLKRTLVKQSQWGFVVVLYAMVVGAVCSVVGSVLLDWPGDLLFPVGMLVALLLLFTRPVGRLFPFAGEDELRARLKEKLLAAGISRTMLEAEDALILDICVPANNVFWVYARRLDTADDFGFCRLLPGELWYEGDTTSLRIPKCAITDLSRETVSGDFLCSWVEVRWHVSGAAESQVLLIGPRPGVPCGSDTMDDFYVTMRRWLDLQ